MSILKFDYELLRNNVLPQLGSINDSLNSILNKFNSMDIPQFNKTNYINETKISIKSDIDSINHIINWISESNRSLDNLIDNYEKEAKVLPLYALNKRDSAIK